MLPWVQEKPLGTFHTALFEFVLPLDYFEPSNSGKAELRRLLKRTFKSFTKLSKTTLDKTIEDLCGYETDSRAQEILLEQAKKWKDRLSTWKRDKAEKDILSKIISEKPPRRRRNLLFCVLRFDMKPNCELSIMVATVFRKSWSAIPQPPSLLVGRILIGRRSSSSEIPLFS